MTLKPLMRMLGLPEDDLVAREVEIARQRALEAAYATLPDENSHAVKAVRHRFESRLKGSAADGNGKENPHSEEDRLYRRALEAARRATFEMRAHDEIGDDAFHKLEEEFDWIEMSIGAGEA